jgi:hypothetical protein
LRKRLNLLLRPVQNERDNKWLMRLGESRIEVSDGVNAIALGLTKNGIEALIGELQTVLDMAD